MTLLSRSGRVLIVAVVALVLAGNAGAQDYGNLLAADLGARVVNAYVRPAIADFAEDAENLVVSLDALCASPDEAALEAARERFADLVAGWVACRSFPSGRLSRKTASNICSSGPIHAA